MKPQPPWEDESGVLVLRLYKTDKHPGWDNDVNKDQLHPDWPRIVLMDLSEEQFKEFEKDPLAFDKKHNIFREQPVLWTSCCAKPPIGKGIPRAAKGSRWTVVRAHGSFSIQACAACPQTLKR